MRLTLLILIVLTGAIISVIFIGRQQNAAIWFTLVNCEQPCWLGIQPSRTTFEESYRILAQYDAVRDDVAGSGQWLRSSDSSPFSFSYYDYPSNGGVNVRFMLVQMLSPVRTGDIIVAWGIPDYVGITSTGNDECRYFFDLEYWERKVVARVSTCDHKITPHTPVRQIFWGNCTVDGICREDWCANVRSRSVWHGFVSETHFSQDICDDP
jgi:hypothetical protein